MLSYIILGLGTTIMIGSGVGLIVQKNKDVSKTLMFTGIATTILGTIASLG